jgi:hypothetical protein
VAALSFRGSAHSPDAVQVRAMAAVAGIEPGRADFAVEIPRSADRIQRSYGAHERGYLKDTGMGGPRDMTDFTSRIAESGIHEPAELNVEAGVASRTSGGVVRMALLAIRQVGLGHRAVVDRLRPAEGMPHLAVAEGAVEAAGLTRVVGGDDRGSQVGPGRVAEGADRGVRSGCIVNRVGMGRRGIGPPGNRRMGRTDRDAVRHVARPGGSAGGKAAHSGYASAEIGPVTFLTTGKTALQPGLRFGVRAVQCGISPTRGMSGRSVCVAALPFEFRTETAHPADSPQEVAAVALKAQAPVAHKRRPVIDDPIGRVPAGCIKSRPARMAGLPVETRIEATDLRYPAPEVAAVTPQALPRIAHESSPVIDNPIEGMLPG